jgi:hypothetical protein
MGVFFADGRNRVKDFAAVFQSELTYSNRKINTVVLGKPRLLQPPKRYPWAFSPGFEIGMQPKSYRGRVILRQGDGIYHLKVVSTRVKRNMQLVMNLGPDGA